MHKWANPTLTCTSCHVYRGDKCHAHPKQALSTARQQGRGVLEPLYTTTSASSSWSRPRNTCSACLSRWHLPRRSPPFIWLGPQPDQKCWQQWPTDELTPSRKRLLPPAWWRQTTTGFDFDSRMLKLKMKSRRGRAGRRRGARVSTVDCARSPYGESTFKRNRPSFAVLMVLGGGGGAVWQITHYRKKKSNKEKRTGLKCLPNPWPSEYCSKHWRPLSYRDPAHTHTHTHSTSSSFRCRQRCCCVCKFITANLWLSSCSDPHLRRLPASYVNLQ